MAGSDCDGKKDNVTNITLGGASGTSYELGIYPIANLGGFPDVNVVYVFIKTTYDKKTKRYRTKAIYVGESGVSKSADKKSGDPDNRLTNSHSQIKCIREEGATHVGLYTGIYNSDPKLKSKTGRLAIEKDLRLKLNPPCNRQ